MTEKVNRIDLSEALQGLAETEAPGAHLDATEVAAYVWGEYVDDPQRVLGIRRHLSLCAPCLRAESALRGEREGVRVLRFVPRRLLNVITPTGEDAAQLAAAVEAAVGSERFESGRVRVRLERGLGNRLVARVAEGDQPQIGWHVRLVSVAPDGAVVADVRHATTDAAGLAPLGAMPGPSDEGSRYCVIVEAPGE